MNILALDLHIHRNHFQSMIDRLASAPHFFFPFLTETDQIARLKFAADYGHLRYVSNFIRLIFTVLFIPLLVATGTTSFASESVEKIEVKVTHSHIHDDHHQHDATVEHAHEKQRDSRDHATPAKSHHDHQGSTEEHTHSIVVSCVHVFFVTVSKNDSVSIPRESSNSFAAPINLYPPRNRALGSIFRPPIAA